MRIVADSSVMFSVEEGAKRGMAVLPLTVSIDGTTWLEYEDISSEEFLALVRAGALPQSASPPPALTLAAYDTDEEVVHLAMADGLSGAYEMACGLRAQARHPERVHVLNTRTLCVPHRALACYAVQLAGQGLGAAEVVGRLEAMMGATRSCLIPEDFDYLRRGARGQVRAPGEGVPRDGADRRRPEAGQARHSPLVQEGDCGRCGRL